MYIKKMNFGVLILKSKINLLCFTGALLSLETHWQIASLDSCIKKFCQPWEISASPDNSENIQM